MDDNQAALIAEQMKHALDLMRAELDAMEARLAHHYEMTGQRLAALEGQSADHETRLRSATEGITQFKVVSGLANGGAGLLSLLALFK
ncbi:MAG TPA: hypothetical protein PKW33_20065 [Anaerolineaceae bacterium]|nr:hypothetical protein [Anaerolineaceae bacterium]HPN53902.1 hypothetical protein [Anaerolineaceae bacterium]